MLYEVITPGAVLMPLISPLSSPTTVRNPIGLDDLIEAQRRLAALGLFRRVNVSQIGHGTGRNNFV